MENLQPTPTEIQAERVVFKCGTLEINLEGNRGTVFMDGKPLIITSLFIEKHWQGNNASVLPKVILGVYPSKEISCPKCGHKDVVLSLHSKQSRNCSCGATFSY